MAPLNVEPDNDMLGDQNADARGKYATQRAPPSTHRHRTNARKPHRVCAPCVASLASSLPNIQFGDFPTSSNGGPLFSHASMGPLPECVIIGAGLAGLQAARRLKDCGVNGKLDTPKRSILDVSRRSNSLRCAAAADDTLTSPDPFRSGRHRSW